MESDEERAVERKHNTKGDKTEEQCKEGERE